MKLDNSGSISLGSRFDYSSGPLAQSVEQRTFNPWVVGSIPTGPTYRTINSKLDK